MRRNEYAAKGLVLLALGWALFSFLAAPATAQCSGNCSGNAEASNMDLVGYNDLQGRSAYYPVIERQGDHWIAYIGHQAGVPRLNPLTGKLEGNGTSVVDVTDPRHPKYIAHIPGEVVEGGVAGAGGLGGAEFARVCSGNDLPHADKNKFYLLRNFGDSAIELWDVTDPAKPSLLNTVVSSLRSPHKNWWECDTGIAYLVGGPLDWLIPPAGLDHDAAIHGLIYDLSNPAKPVFIRSFGLPGQQPGSAVPEPRGGLHGVISAGPKVNRVYFSYDSQRNGVVEIVDREKLLNGPKEPTDENLRYPVVGRIDLPPDIGAHTAFPLLRMQLPEFAKDHGSVKDFLAQIGEEYRDNCSQDRQILRIFDITYESYPVGVSTWTVPEASANFCDRGGRFGTHASNESFTPIYYKRVLFVTFFNAGVRAIDVRDPYHPTEIGYYIPAVTGNTERSCVDEGGQQHCKIATQTNNVEVDDRGFIYIVDRANTGMHILELTGPARQAADFSQAENSPDRK
jgi:hypothetical protein